MITGRYVGQMEKLVGKRALLRRSKYPGYILAQFDEAEDRELCQGWTPFLREEFEIVDIPSNYFSDVGDFHTKFDLPRLGDGGAPQLLPDDVLDFRTKFMVEELTEFMDCHRQGDLAGAADALVDLVYVALGTAHFMRVPFEACWNEVQRANMTKVRAESADDPLSKRKHRFDVVKPPGFKPPDHGPILEKARKEANGEE